MKKMIIVTIITASMCLSVKAQDIFTGIGIFKIGTDTSYLYNYAKSNKIKIISCGDEMKIFRMENSLSFIDNQIFRLTKSKSDLGVLTLSRDTNTKEFFISSYFISGIKVNSIRLLYYKGKLLRFKCKPTQEIISAINSKYGDPVSFRTSDTIYCTHNLTGIQTPLIGYTKTDTWKGKDAIAEAVSSKYYDDHCKESFMFTFSYKGDDYELVQSEASLSKDYLKSLINPKIEKSTLKDF